MKTIAPILLCAALSFVTPASAAGFNITDIVRASDADLDAGIADAQAHNDTFAVECYTGIKTYNAANPQTSFVPNIAGVVSGFQVARDVVKAGQGGGVTLIPPELVQACGPLALDVQNDISHASFMLFGFKLF